MIKAQSFVTSGGQLFFFFFGEIEMNYLIFTIWNYVITLQEKRHITTSNITKTKIIGVIYIVLHL